jgi:hypothetical protein
MTYTVDEGIRIWIVLGMTDDWKKKVLGKTCNIGSFVHHKSHRQPFIVKLLIIH